jgi:nucleoside-diphosphate-sugar epimerase
MAYHRQYGVDVRIARIFNTYGPRLDPGSMYARVIPRFIMQALRNEPLTIHDDGMQTRSFTYVTDTANALIRMLVNDNVRGEVVNIGSQNEVSIMDLAKMIIRLTDSSSKMVFTEARPDDPRKRCPNISKAKRLLGWEPKISLEDGLQYTIEWFKRRFNG